MPTPVITDGKVKLLPYSIGDLSVLYNVCVRTINKWISPFANDIGKRMGRYYTVAQVRTIIDKIGLPEDWTLEE